MFQGPRRHWGGGGNPGQRPPPSLKEDQAQFFEALAQFVESHASKEAVEGYLRLRNFGVSVPLTTFLQDKRAAIWQHDILDKLFDRSQLRKIAKTMGLQVSRRAAKRRIIATLLQTMGFCADKIWR